MATEILAGTPASPISQTAEADREDEKGAALNDCIQLVWDALALVRGALSSEEFKNDMSGPNRLVQLAEEKLHELDEVLSPLV